MKPLIDDAAALPSTDVIERRVLSLMHADPGAPGYPFTVTNLNAGLQILLPGESARPHRHSMNALRFVLDGRGATTVVDGRPCLMEEGDLILTPGWTWHEHTHAGAGPIVWLDVLDASLHRYLKTDAFEPGPAHDVPEPGPASPAFRFPWAAAAAALETAPRSADGSRRLHYADPASGGATMSLLDCYLIEIDAGAETVPLRTSSHAVCAVMEGHGSTRAGDATIAWGPKDVFSLPSGLWTSHRAERRVRLFMATDREILRRLDLLEETLAANAGGP